MDNNKSTLLSAAGVDRRIVIINHLGLAVLGSGSAAARALVLGFVVVAVGEAVAKRLVVGPLLAQREVEHREGRVSGDELYVGQIV